MSELMLKVRHLSKMYRLGQIGGTTLREEIQRWTAKRRHQEDPTRKIGAADYEADRVFMALEDVSFDVKKGERVCFLQVFFGKNCKQKWRKLHLQNGEFCRGSQTGILGLGSADIHQCLRVAKGLDITLV